MRYRLPVYAYETPRELREKRSYAYPVVIVGAGLAGLAAGLELGARGVRTVLIDEDNTVGAAGLSSRGICYAKRSLEIFDRYGVAERIRAKGVTWNEGEVYRGAERLYRFNLQPETDQKFPAFVNLQQFYVEQYLVERLQQMPSVELRWKNRVIAVDSGTDHVALKVETPEGVYEIRGEYVLACDGAHSVVRGQLGARDAESERLESTWCIADVRMAPSAEAVRRAYLDSPLNDGGAIWYHQMADGVWRTDWLITHYPDREAQSKPERAEARLKKLLGERTPFELVWVGPYRFRKRYLERMRLGRVFFLGDAAAQHSPFGARGGNRAIQDADNLAWKLALVLEGKAAPALLDTYHEERHPAAREAVEHSTRSAVFIGPETPGQRLVRDAILDLAQRHEWARPMVNVGRLSVAARYASVIPGCEQGSFGNDLARPGAPAPDGRLAEGFFVEQLGGAFVVAWFGEAGPSLDVKTVFVRQEGHEALFERYGVQGTATYVFRPDGHVLARAAGIDPDFAREAIASVLACRPGAGAPSAEEAPPQLRLDRLYDELAAQVDAAPEAERPLVLGRAVRRARAALGAPPG